VRYLLDVNVLVAWGWSDHEDHARVAAWIARTMHDPTASLLTASIPQLGFVRVSVQRTGGQVSPQQAGKTLAGMLAQLGASHEFLPDDCPVTRWPDWCRSAGSTTDAHLLALASKHDAQLATLDAGIPGAYLIPAPVRTRPRRCPPSRS